MANLSLRLARCFGAAAAMLLVASPAAPAFADIAGEARENGRFDRFFALAEEAGLLAALSDAEHFTVFAPTDTAFARLPEDALEGRQPEALRALLRRHAVIGQTLPSRALPQSVKTASGETLRISLGRDGLRVSLAGDEAAALVVKGDLEAGRGIIHGLDGVLLQPAPEGEEDRPFARLDEEAALPIDERLTSPLQAEGEVRARTAQRRAETPFLTEIPELPSRKEGDGADGGQGSGEAAGREARGARDGGEDIRQRLTVSALKEMTVLSRDEKQEGEVAALVLSPATGEIEFLLIEFGGFLGLFGGKTLEVPWSEVTVARGSPELLIGLTAEEIAEAEGVDPDDY